MSTSYYDLTKFRNVVTTRPLNVLFSSCLIGVNCGWEGDSYDEDIVLRIFKNPNVISFKFCPENFSFGTPREFCSIHGGDGFDVLDGKARLLTVAEVDWTDGALKASKHIVELAQKNKIDLAIMMDISPSCGTTIIYKGKTANKIYQAAPGISAAALIRAGIDVVSSRQSKDLSILLSMVDPNYETEKALVNFVDDEWYTGYFGNPTQD